VYKIAICDDERFALNAITEELHKVKSAGKIECFDDAGSLMERLGRNKFDIVLMDIDFKSAVNGIDYAEKLYVSSPKTKIIFVTGYSEQYIESVFMKKTNIEGYLSKPVTAEKIEKLFKKIEDRKIDEENRKLVIRQRKNMISISYHKIKYIESISHHVRIHTTDDLIEVYSKLSEIQENLPDNFCRCHRSYIVNMDYVKRLTKEGIYMENGKETLPVSKVRFKAVSEKLCEYAGENI